MIYVKSNYDLSWNLNNFDPFTLNSLYGSVGSPMAHWFDYRCGEYESI